MLKKEKDAYIEKIKSQLTFPDFGDGGAVEIDFSFKYEGVYGWNRSNNDSTVDFKYSKVLVKVTKAFKYSQGEMPKRSISLKKLTIPKLQAKINEVGVALGRAIERKQKSESHYKKSNYLIKKHLAAFGVEKYDYYESGKIYITKEDVEYSGIAALENGKVAITITEMRLFNGGKNLSSLLKQKTDAKL